MYHCQKTFRTLSLSPFGGRPEKKISPPRKAGMAKKSNGSAKTIQKEQRKQVGVP